MLGHPRGRNDVWLVVMPQALREGIPAPLPPAYLPGAGTQISDQEECGSCELVKWARGQESKETGDWKPLLSANPSLAPSISGACQGAAAKEQSGDVVCFTSKAQTVDLELKVIVTTRQLVNTPTMMGSPELSFLPPSLFLALFLMRTPLDLLRSRPMNAFSFLHRLKHFVIFSFSSISKVLLLRSLLEFL